MKKKTLLLFDGVCNLCNAFVQFIIIRDRKRQIFFAPLQSELGQQLLKDSDEKVNNLNTVVLIKDDEVYTHSDVALEVAKIIRGGWQFFSIFHLLPKGFRDKVYDWVAANRYKWFGKKDQCMLPSADTKDRFPTTMEELFIQD